MMRMDKDSSKSGGGYVGGFFQLFDWKAKSRKKLFSSKSDLPERSKQGKIYEGNLPTTATADDDETGAATSFKGSSDYSCASSITDDEGYGNRPPGVVARLMGLDSMPMSSYAEPYSSPLSDTQNLHNAHYHRRKLSYHHDHHIMHSGDLYKLDDRAGNLAMELNPQNISSRPSNLVKESKPHRISSTPIERFQTEGLPPKSAKSIPITHHKLLSPIKSPGFIPSKNAAYIMEAAARIIEPGRQAVSKTKMPLVSSSSIPLKVRDLKEKAEAGKKMSTVGSSAVSLKVQEIKERVEATYKSTQLAESSQRLADSNNASKDLKGQPFNKSWNGSVDTTSFSSSYSGENSTESNNKRKSVSLAIQAKVNVQRRQGLNSSGNRSLLEQKEQTDRRVGQPFKSQSNIQKNLHKKTSVQNVSVLRQNNQKQNCPSGKTKITSKSLANSQGRKVLSGDLSSGRHKESNKVAGNTKPGSRKSSLEATGSEKNLSSNGANTLPRKKRMLEGEHFDRNQTENRLSNKNHKSILSDEMSERPLIWTDDGRKKGMDVVSFTFTAPITKSMSKPEAFSVIKQKSSEVCTEHHGKRMLLESENMKLSSLGYNVIGGDALSLLLEEKLKELTLGVDTPHQDGNLGSISSSTSMLGDLQGPRNSKAIKTWSTDIENNSTRADKLCAQYDSESFSAIPPAHKSQNKFLFQGVDEMDAFSSNKNDVRKSVDCRSPSPVSILEPSMWTESCNSSYSTDSNIMEGSIQCSSVEATGYIGLTSAKQSYSLDIDMELSDSASSTSVGIKVEKQPTGSSETPFLGSTWELEYVREILCNVELMFRDFALGQALEIVNPHLFHQLETRRERMGSTENNSLLSRKLLFDGVSECLDLKCRRYAGRGFRTWVEGVGKVRRTDQLAKEVFREISGWRGMNNCMVDELVDKDMSSRHGKWLDYEVDAFSLGVEIEDQILSSLVDEVFADIMRC